MTEDLKNHVSLEDFIGLMHVKMLKVKDKSKFTSNLQPREYFVGFAFLLKEIFILYYFETGNYYEMLIRNLHIFRAMPSVNKIQ